MVKGTGIGSGCQNKKKKKGAWQVTRCKDKENSFRGVECPCFQLQNRSFWNLFSLHWDREASSYFIIPLFTDK